MNPNLAMGPAPATSRRSPTLNSNPPLMPALSCRPEAATVRVRRADLLCPFHATEFPGAPEPITDVALRPRT